MFKMILYLCAKSFQCCKFASFHCIKLLHNPVPILGNVANLQQIVHPPDLQENLNFFNFLPNKHKRSKVMQKNIFLYKK